MFVYDNKFYYSILTLKGLCDNIYSGANTAKSGDKLFAYYLTVKLVKHNKKENIK